MFKHLYYGGSKSTKTKVLGTKPGLRVQFKTQKRFETIVRLEAAGFGESAIAAMLCISKLRLSQIRKSEEYLAARMQITHGIILDHDKKVSQIKEQRRELMTQMLPDALRIVATELTRPAVTINDRKLQTTIALELMDREGTFAKVSRTEVKPVDAFDFERADAESSLVIDAIKNVTPSKQKSEKTSVNELIEASSAFSNSRTLSSSDQQAALAKLEEEAKKLDLLELMPIPESKRLN